MLDGILEDMQYLILKQDLQGSILFYRVSFCICKMGSEEDLFKLELNFYQAGLTRASTILSHNIVPFPLNGLKNRPTVIKRFDQLFIYFNF